ncbi:MAG TPA: NAD-dependent deacylase [Pirellulaceae bacterium]|nr:NAD-dependent deacylase [Pirellulaceae bacterium]
MNIVVLTGAGISQESGLMTFRGAGSEWKGMDVSYLANIDTFQTDPQLVFDFYNFRRRALQAPTVQPNAAHLALAELEQSLPDGAVTIVTQNVDNLHERAGSRRVIHIHGELLKARCLDTGELFDWTDDLGPETPHPRDASHRGRLRPHVVWFGEMPLDLDIAFRDIKRCDLFLAVGTSGHVWPAAGLVQDTRPDCRRVEINLEDTPVATSFDECRRGKASLEVPQFVSELLHSLGRPQGMVVP